MQTLLIADPSEPFADAVAAALQNDFSVKCCHDGETALEMLLSFRPDVLILNFRLPFKDGLTVLQECAHRPQVILGVSTFLNTYIEQTAAALGVQYIMTMPTVNALRVRLMDLVANTGNPAADLSDQSALHLHILNFPTHLHGYRQLCVALPIFAANPDISLSKELYPMIAKRFGLSDARTVEHSIRKAVEAAWEQHDPVVWAKYFPPKPDGSIPCPSNKAFLSRLGEMLKLSTHP